MTTTPWQQLRELATAVTKDPLYRAGTHPRGSQDPDYIALAIGRDYTGDPRAAAVKDLKVQPRS
jgi:hypothetical protein